MVDPLVIIFILNKFLNANDDIANNLRVEPEFLERLIKE